MSDEAWDSPLGRYILARAEYDRARRNGTLFGMVNAAPPEDADAAFLREITLAHEVCDEQVAADAGVVSLPMPPLPFGGPESP